MELIGEEKKMTVQEVADVLGYEKDYLRKKVKELFPESVKNGKETVLTESQVTILKTMLVPRTLDMKVQGENAVTDIEKQETIIRAFQYLKDGYEQMKARAIAAETRTERLIHNSTTYTSGEIAKELGLKSAQELHGFLRDNGIIFKDTRGVWQLYSEYAGKGFQNIKQAEKNGTIIYYAEWTGIGRDWLIGLFSKGNK